MNHIKIIDFQYQHQHLHYWFAYLDSPRCAIDCFNCSCFSSRRKSLPFLHNSLEWFCIFLIFFISYFLVHWLFIVYTQLSSTTRPQIFEYQIWIKKKYNENRAIGLNCCLVVDEWTATTTLFLFLFSIVMQLYLSVADAFCTYSDHSFIFIESLARFNFFNKINAHGKPIVARVVEL